MAAKPFTRREFTTRGSDPTVVVEWRNGDFILTEFQGVICCEPKAQAGHKAEMVQPLAEALHDALERAHSAEEEARETRMWAEERLADFE